MPKRLALFVSIGIGVFAFAPGKVQAQFFPGIPQPTPFAPAWVGPGYTYNYGNYLSPYGYQQYYNYATYPDVFGSFSYQYGYSYTRSTAVGPLHSVYWSSSQNRYIYLP